MQNNQFFTHPNAIENILNGTLDLDTDGIYAALMLPHFTPALAQVNYGDFAQVTTGSITGATQANPVVITSSGHGLNTGDHVSISGVGGMTQLNGNTYEITVIDANSFSLQSDDGTDIDGTGFTAYTSGGTWYETYEATAQADYSRQDLGNTNIITVNGRRAFDCDNINFGTNVTLHAMMYGLFFGSAASPNATDLLLGWEFLNPVSGQITGITAANPGVVTSNGHGLSNSDVLLIQRVDMLNVAINDTLQTVANQTANTFELSGKDLSGAHAAGRTGRWTKLNATQEASSTNSDFAITIPSGGLFEI